MLFDLLLMMNQNFDNLKIALLYFLVLFFLICDLHLFSFLLSLDFSYGFVHRLLINIEVLVFGMPFYLIFFFLLHLGNGLGNLNLNLCFYLCRLMFLFLLRFLIRVLAFFFWGKYGPLIFCIFNDFFLFKIKLFMRFLIFF